MVRAEPDFACALDRRGARNLQRRAANAGLSIYCGHDGSYCFHPILVVVIAVVASGCRMAAEQFSYFFIASRSIVRSDSAVRHDHTFVGEQPAAQPGLQCLGLLSE